ncbi:MAG: YncE family protein [bacterium]|nr:YncE family protein [bacterium]MDI1335150.1 YncE family protein [Lacunisphaera sp.]
MKLKIVAFAALTWVSLPAQPFYQLESALTIKSPTAPSWDYLTYDAARDVLLIARRDDGILLYDAKAKKITGALEDSKGGNSTVLVPEFDRGYVVKQDGTLLIFQASTYKKIGSVSVGDNADNAFYDPVTKQLLVTQGDSSQVTFVDAKAGAVTGVLKIDSESIEGCAADGEGNFYTALRDRDKVVKIDARARTLVAAWKVGNHIKPNGVAYDQTNHRLFVSTRGDNPALLVYDPTGKIIAEPIIGRGNDQVVFDADAKKIYTANGFDGTVVIIDQVDANTYKLAEAPTTRPYARTMALDPKTKTIYLTTAEGTIDPAKKIKTEVGPFYPNKYFKDTFTLLTYTRK